MPRISRNVQVQNLEVEFDGIRDVQADLEVRIGRLEAKVDALSKVQADLEADIDEIVGMTESLAEVGRKCMKLLSGDWISTPGVKANKPMVGSGNAGPPTKKSKVSAPEEK
uniref:Uncharacterized protein n=1 Tax=Grammatophora oceanica TaxID=210454 RepID=A0A7S1UNC6_9STRA